jgi:hypothetical protein
MLERLNIRTFATPWETDREREKKGERVEKDLPLLLFNRGYLISNDNFSGTKDGKQNPVFFVLRPNAVFLFLLLTLLNFYEKLKSANNAIAVVSGVPKIRPCKTTQ